MHHHPSVIQYSHPHAPSGAPNVDVATTNMASYGRCDTPNPKWEICNCNGTASLDLVSLSISSYCLSSFLILFFLFFSFVFFWPFCGTSVITPSLTVTRPRPSERRAPRRQDPSTGGHSFRVFSLFYSLLLKRPARVFEQPRARLPGLVGKRPWAEGAPPQIGAPPFGTLWALWP